MKYTCLWILSKPGEQPVRRCDKPTGFTMGLDDDHRRVRRPRPFCDEHQREADKQDAEDAE